MFSCCEDDSLKTEHSKVKNEPLPQNKTRGYFSTFSSKKFIKNIFQNDKSCRLYKASSCCDRGHKLNFVLRLVGNEANKHAVHIQQIVKNVQRRSLEISADHWLEPCGALAPVITDYQLKGWNTGSYHLGQTGNQLTFMLPRRLARSMTRNFLMRSLGGKWKQSVNPQLYSMVLNSREKKYECHPEPGKNDKQIIITGRPSCVSLTISDVRQ